MPCAPRMLGCHRRCLHREKVQAYRDAVLVWEQQRDAVCHGWVTEEAEWERDHPRPLFKDWLIASANPVPMGVAA